jgi:hypothetical protein
METQRSNFTHFLFFFLLHKINKNISKKVCSSICQRSFCMPTFSIFGCFVKKLAFFYSTDKISACKE